MRTESLLTLALLVLLFVIANPFGLFMPGMAVMLLLLALLVLFALFAAFLWRERGGDERESLHRLIADRTGFLAGSGILVLAIVLEEYRGALDLWLLYALAVMIIGKALGLLHTKKNL